MKETCSKHHLCILSLTITVFLALSGCSKSGSENLGADISNTPTNDLRTIGQKAIGNEANSSSSNEASTWSWFTANSTNSECTLGVLTKNADRSAQQCIIGRHFLSDLESWVPVAEIDEINWSERGQSNSHIFSMRAFISPVKDELPFSRGFVYNSGRDGLFESDCDLHFIAVKEYEIKRILDKSTNKLDRFLPIGFCSKHGVTLNRNLNVQKVPPHVANALNQMHSIFKISNWDLYPKPFVGELKSINYSPASSVRLNEDFSYTRIGVGGEKTFGTWSVKFKLNESFTAKAKELVIEKPNLVKTNHVVLSIDQYAAEGIRDGIFEINGVKYGGAK